MKKAVTVAFVDGTVKDNAGAMRAMLDAYRSFGGRVIFARKWDEIAKFEGSIAQMFVIEVDDTASRVAFGVMAELFEDAFVTERTLDGE